MFTCNICKSENIEYQAELDQRINPNKKHPYPVTTRADWRVKCNTCGAVETRPDIHDHLFDRSESGERLEAIRRASVELYEVLKAVKEHELFGHSAWQELWEQIDKAIAQAELPYGESKCVSNAESANRLLHEENKKLRAYEKFYWHIRHCVNDYMHPDTPVICKVCRNTFEEITGIAEQALMKGGE